MDCAFVPLVKTALKARTRQQEDDSLVVLLPLQEAPTLQYRLRREPCNAQQL
ncbi:hypothetical protein V2J09_006428 [Rumex salicifolius]